ncbi:THAP domain-containing protein [Phthorimaea operculella]|nr:THAP domain-containing protein [Phthorimaea operculella]
MNISTKNPHTYCSIQNCKTTIFNKGDFVTFHQFPTSTEMRNKWLTILKNRCPSIDWNRSRICSRHFENRFFDSQRQLRSNAIPTLFQVSGEKFRISKAAESASAPRTRLDRMLSVMSQTELQNDIKNTRSGLKMPDHLSSFVNEDLKCQPLASTETQLWLLIKKQEHLISKLNQSLIQNKKHVEILQKNLQESREEKKEMEKSVDHYKYISKCLQEKHATLEEQIEILTAIESRI